MTIKEIILNIIVSIIDRIYFIDFLDRIDNLRQRTELKQARKKGKIADSVVFSGRNIKIIEPENVTIGEGSAFHGNTFLYAEGALTIGHHVHVGPGFTVFTSNHNFRSNQLIPYDKTVVIKPVIIKDCVWIGANVSIIPGITIEEGAVVGMGAIITKDVPRGAIVGGNPAKVIGYRDLDKFDQLKLVGKFF